MSLLADYHKAVAYVESFSNISLRNNFGKNRQESSIFVERTKYFLGLLGNPERGFRYIHITGTAGKGTVSTMIQEVLMAAGHKTGLFTSPYVTTTIEKIKINDQYINPEELINFVEYLKPFIDKARRGPYGTPSAFELFFVVALLHFQKERCEWVVLEVGVGGRYDATNVITNPVVTAITNIDYDHMEILGKTLKKIANDKMGIIKTGSYFFTSEQRPILQKLFKKYCRQMGAGCRFIEKQADYLDYNVELVRSIARYLKISEKDIENGVVRTRLPCRFEIIQNNPIVVLDGAHNRAKIRSTISNLAKYKFNRLYLLLAIADNKKDHWAILEPILSLSYRKEITFTQVITNERRSVNPSLLLTLAMKNKRKGDIVKMVTGADKAFVEILKKADRNDLVLVTGSFFLAGELRKRWVSEEWILKNCRSYKNKIC